MNETENEQYPTSVLVDDPEEVILRPQVASEVLTGQRTRDKALLARLDACPRNNKANFAFGKFLLAAKFYDQNTRARTEEEAVNLLLSIAVAIASERQWRHPDDQEGKGQRRKGGWRGVAWDCLVSKAAKYEQLNADEIFEHISTNKFWAWRWLYEAMISVFRGMQAERKRAAKYYFATRPDTRRKGQAIQEYDPASLYERIEDANDADSPSSGGDILQEICEIPKSADTLEIDENVTSEELKFETNPEGEYELHNNYESPQDKQTQISSEQKRKILAQVDPEFLAHIDRLSRDKHFALSTLGKEIGDFDSTKLKKLATLVLRTYAQIHGLSQRTAERRVETVRELFARDKQFLSRFCVPRR